ncbi:septum site-determining protein MinC [Crenobacter sp. SG2305]|uniref:septum site-determining protein MinC n=1 Tax=Crenobacter oryzisoli TaxID=3056844 RepID=UPI0025AA3F0A|nr:septum site-determining protein MinC [Crenobacter sp. SG2305]MDN0081841.1 septum site-determining protein MinC [Crenobacter sp. SG2305]
MSQTAHAFDIKSASLDLLALLLKTADPAELQTALDARFGNATETASEAFLLDLDGLPNAMELPLAELLPLFSRYGIRVVGLRHSSRSLAALASQHGLAFSQASTPPRGTLAETAAPEAPVVAAPVAAAPAQAPVSVPAQTLIIDRPVRAGQQIYARGGDLVVLAMISAGAEVIADGNIHIYAPLRGRALAGARGNLAARIFTQSMEAELVSIAGVYRTIEQRLPESILGKPTQIYLDSERLVMTALGE